MLFSLVANSIGENIYLRCGGSSSSASLNSMYALRVFFFEPKTCSERAGWGSPLGGGIGIAPAGTAGPTRFW
jgi:hypothetical protein